MKKAALGLMGVWLILCVGFLGCSKSTDQTETPKATVEEATEATTEAIQKKINTPIDKARTAQGLGEERTKGIDEAVKQ